MLSGSAFGSRFESRALWFLPAKDENNTANYHCSDSNVRLPVQSEYIVPCYSEFSPVRSALSRDIGKARVEGHEQTHDEDDEASGFHNCDPSLTCIVRMPLLRSA
jgi:hypothetical protein